MTTYLDLRATAAAIGMSTVTVRRYVASGELPAARLGRALRFHPDDVDAFMRRRAVRPRTLSA